MQAKLLTLHVQQLKGLRSVRRQSPGQLLHCLACTVSSGHGKEPLQKARLAVKQFVQLQCTGLSIEGQGVCRHDSGMVVFCERTLPGEVLLAEITSVKAGHATAVKQRTLRQHDLPAQPRCQHFGPCGGCSLQSLQYAAQLQHKQQLVVAALRRIAKLPDAGQIVLPIIPSRQQYGYRNKMVFTFSSDIWQSDTQDPQDSNSTSAGQPVLAAPLSAGAAAADPPHKATFPPMAPTLPGQPKQPAADPQPHGSQEAAPAAATSAGAHRPPVPIAAAAQRPHTGSQQLPVCPGSRQLALGLHTSGSFTRVVPIQECQLQTDESNAILRAVAAAAQQAGLSPWNPATQQGQLRQVTLRSNAQGEHFVHLSCAQQVPAQALQQLVDAMLAACSSIVGIVHMVEVPPPPRQGRQRGQRPSAAALKPALGEQGTLQARSIAQKHLHHRGPNLEHPSSEPCCSAAHRQPRCLTVCQGDAVLSALQTVGSKQDTKPIPTVLHGGATFSERLAGLNFQLSPAAFFQTNTDQAETLIQLVSAAARLKPADTLLDLYCGVGAIGLCLASQCRQVLGWEAVPQAVADARLNARLNSIAHAQFFCDDLQKPFALPTGCRVDVIVADPARAGMSKRVVEFCQAAGAQRIVYVSCNPSTMARDLASLTAQGQFDIVSVQPVDMFPQTSHVECIAVLQRCRP